MNIVPVNATLQAEIRIRPSDIEFIIVNNLTFVKVTTYYFTKF
ncbi:hypothetical protein [Coxiella-like endosymbiont]|nr:hypothetical protein [Coxiella-like endosymbiont]